MRQLSTKGALLGATLLAFQPLAEAVPYGFYGISNNHPAAVLEGEASLMVDVVGLGANQVVFTNDSITDIYFDDGTLLSMVLR
jgi:hypothetical protein